MPDWCLNHKDTPANKHSVVNGSCCWFLEIYRKIVIKSQKKSCKGTCMVNSQAKKYQQPNNSETHHRQSHKTWFHQITSRWTFFFRLTSPWIWISLREIWTSRLSTQGTFFRIFCHLPKMVYSNHLQKTPFVCFEWLPRSGRSNVVSSGSFSFWFGDLPGSETILVKPMQLYRLTMVHGSL